MSDKKERLKNGLRTEDANTQPYQGLDDDVFDALEPDAPEHPDGTLIAEPYPIMDIVPDITQPRDVLPAKIRAGWNGTPETIPGLLMKWHKEVESVYETIAIADILDGKHIINPAELKEDAKEKDIPATAIEFLALVSLAATIHADGLINPITIGTNGSPRIIVAGERRYLSYHLLNMFYRPYYAEIPAFQKKADVWAQARENGARRPLNATGMAAQIANLLMDLYKDTPGADFQPIHQLVVGANKLPYFAQVKNGNTYPLKKEFVQKILDATGLKSANQIRQYRRILDLPPEIWMQANEENWTENYIRTYMQEQNQPDDDSRTGVTAVTLDTDNNGSQSTKKDISILKERYAGEYVELNSGKFGKVWGVKPDARIEVLLHGQRFTSLIAEFMIVRIIDEATYNELTGKTSPETKSSSGIKRYMLSKGVRILTKHNESLTIEKPAYGGNSFECIKDNGIRKTVDFKDIVAIVSQEDVPDTVTHDETTATGKFAIGQQVLIRNGMNQYSGKVMDFDGDHYTVYVNHLDKYQKYEEWLINPVEDETESTGGSQPPSSGKREYDGNKYDSQGNIIIMGSTVRTASGHTGVVNGVDGRALNVKTVNGTRPYLPEHLTVIQPEDDQPEETTDDPLDDFIFAEFDDTFMPLHALSLVIKDKDATDVLVHLGQMTEDELFALAEHGTLSTTFQTYYETIRTMMTTLNAHVAEIMDKVETYGLNPDGEDDD